MVDEHSVTEHILTTFASVEAEQAMGYLCLFGPTAPDLRAYDFTAPDTLMPHPHYAAQSLLCVLSSSAATFQKLQPLLKEAYDLAARRAAS